MILNMSLFLNSQLGYKGKYYIPTQLSVALGDGASG